MTDKVILVDAVHCLVDKEGNINKELKDYLDSLQNKKIILTNAPVEKHELLFKNVQDYEIFTLEGNPDKKNSNYYKTFLGKFKLSPVDVIYLEHDEESVNSAESVGIKVIHYTDDLKSVKDFIGDNL